MDINTLAELVNAETIRDLKSIEFIKSEDIKGEILSNEETVRRIEERRRSITAESQSRSSGLRSESKYATNVRGSEPQKNYSSSYTSYANSNSYTYGRAQPTIESRAREYSNYVFKKAIESVNRENKKNIWNMFELDEREKMKDRKTKPVNKKYDKLKINLLQFGATFLKGVMEDLYISLNNDRK